MSGSTRVIWRRGFAHWIDSVLPFVLAYGAAVAVRDDEGTLFVILFAILALATFVGSFMILQGLTGYTPGKWLLGIRVVNAEGRPPGVAAGMKHTLPLLLEWYGLIGAFAISLHEHGQRFGDRWAGTYVVRARRGELPRPVGLPA